MNNQNLKIMKSFVQLTHDPPDKIHGILVARLRRLTHFDRFGLNELFRRGRRHRAHAYAHRDHAYRKVLA